MLFSSGGSTGRDMYNVPKYGSDENYMIQTTEPSMQLTSPFEQGGAMHNEGAPEFVVDQGLIYPAATSYGYYCTGFDAPGEWEDHHRIFGVDGPDIQYTGAQNESLPYVYYTPTYGYAQSPYNPYNPYIPGAMVGVDSPVVGAQQYYLVSQYQSAVSSAYVPLVLQPDMIPGNTSESLYGTGASINRSDGQVSKNNFNSVSGAFPSSVKSTSNATKSPSSMMSRGSKTSGGPSKHAVTKGSNPAGGFPSPDSLHVLQGRHSFGSIEPVDSHQNGEIPSHHNQLKVSIPSTSGLSNSGPSNHGRATVAKLRPKVQVVTGPDSLVEQNWGPEVNRPKTDLAVKAYTTRAGGTNGQGNLIIYTDQYNKEDLPVEYTDAKFFVIKSYSEDDVHKSIKYNVWSSTSHGNKKLSSAFEDAQRIAAWKPGGCPIFLFFSVNVSGQFCGVAEMIGPVDFNRDMDFWQQDKWNGSFPVKWHIVKDVPNTSLRHIILENNENKPVTNSRDTQEIMYEKGLEMLKFFKNYTSKTSLLDDFMYYETRQKIILDEKARSHVRSYGSPFFAPASGPPRKLNCVVEIPPNKVEIGDKHKDDPNDSTRTVTGKSEQASSQTNTTNSDKYDASSLKIATLSIDPKRSDLVSPVSASFGSDREPYDLKVGSVSLKLNGNAESSGFLTFGTIPLDPNALLFEKGKGKGKGVVVANKGS